MGSEVGVTTLLIKKTAEAVRSLLNTVLSAGDMVRPDRTSTTWVFAHVP